jgi:biotin carboxyl carrier protein
MAAKLHVLVNGKDPAIALERSNAFSAWGPSGGSSADVVSLPGGGFSVVLNGRSYRALVIKEDRETKTLRVRVGGNLYTVQVQDEQQVLMRTLGLDRTARTAVRELKAPMPGLVLKVLVGEGQAVKKGEPLLILEAMKMENLIRAAGDATVARVTVNQGTAVEKGQLLIQFQ